MVKLRIMKAIMAYVREWLGIIFWSLNAKFKSDKHKELEIVALRMQLAYYKRQVEKKNLPKPRTSIAHQQFWVLLSKYYKNWRKLPLDVTPRTVKNWHKTAFKRYWWKKSKPVGRPKISSKTKELIKSIHSKNPLLSAEKIHEMLINMNYTDVPCANKIREILGQDPKKPPTEKQVQSWKTFLKNHRDIWAMDFFTVPTLTFKILYVLIIINHDTRKIEHFGVTYNPNTIWLKQQFREATPFDNKPKYLIHDNDPVFVSDDFQEFLSSSDIKSKRISYRSPWQNGIAERSIGSIRRELTDHIIPVNEMHLHRLMKEYVNEYYNTNRTHQGINCTTPIPTAEYPESKFTEGKMIPKEILGGLYHTYKKVA
jgi:transposase InsO family protein